MKTYDVIMTPSDDGSWVLKSEAVAEIHKLQRALWLSRAEMARTSAWVFWNRKDDYNYNKWKKVEFKCRAKAEEYK